MMVKVYSAEFKAGAVASYLSDPKNTYEAVGRDLDQPEDAAELGAGRASPTRPHGGCRWLTAGGPDYEVASDDVLKEESKQLRARIRELETEQEILRRAAKYFGDETIKINRTSKANAEALELPGFQHHRTTTSNRSAAKGPSSKTHQTRRGSRENSRYLPDLHGDVRFTRCPCNRQGCTE